ncbi:zinc cluster transcriptional activator [Dipodascopsis tothii]|uniref:zinc cluster transcriptional activator n=1 Tax=Dipodascopsis tothii TaxID=44089 RepID=UPI0034D01288
MDSSIENSGDMSQMTNPITGSRSKEVTLAKTGASTTSTTSAGGSINKSQKRRKVDHACVYCRRSHMTCDSERPCSRCLKRNIGHLCHDEQRDGKSKGQSSNGGSKSSGNDLQGSAAISSSASSGSDAHSEAELDDEVQEMTQTSKDLSSTGSSANFDWSSMLSGPGVPGSALMNLAPYQPSLLFAEPAAGSELSSLNDFLTMLEDNSSNHMQETKQLEMRGSNEVSAAENRRSSSSQGTRRLRQLTSGEQHDALNSHANASGTSQQIGINSSLAERGTLPTVTSSSSAETASDKFFLTAADPSGGPEGTPEDRLKQVINAKLEAGLLAPFNYVKGYARLQKYMDNHMSPVSRQRILKPLSIFRPAFRAIAQSLIDVDLVLVEEAFERMLLDYDRVFTSMAIPACLWRRTGEIYRGNKEFAALVEVPVEDLRDGRLAIYELMSEDSTVNYWEKYGNIAFDSGQKAVLTSCTLKSRDGLSKRSCCFSFTIRRDRYNIPSCIIGNFIPVYS